MAKLSQEMKDVVKVVGKGGALVHLATCSADGVPNIVAERFVATWQDEYIIIAEMFAQKTKVNLNENEVACVSIANPVRDHTWVFRGPATVISFAAPKNYQWHGIKAGELLDEWGEWSEKEPPDEVPPDIAPPKLKQRGIIVIKVDEAYNFAPDKAGEALL